MLFLADQFLPTAGFVTATVIDLFVLVMVVLNAVRGSRVGLVRQLGFNAGFIVGTFMGVQLVPWMVGATPDRLGRSVLTLLTVVGAGLLMGYVGERIIVDIKWPRTHPRLIRLGAIFGAGMSGAVTLGIFWLVAALFLNSPFANLASGLERSVVLRGLSSVLPPAPAAITQLQTIIDPNGFPQVFVELEPWPAQPVPAATQPAIATAAAQNEASTLYITGFGCGGVVSGSGFVVAPDIVATNAHVIAGIARPLAFDRNGPHLATPVLFDAYNDVALLRISHLRGSPLNLAPQIVERGTEAVVLGYPGGGPFSARPSSILDAGTITGHDIYGRGEVDRSAYTLQASIQPGDSGGPIVAPDGTVIGMVFARSAIGQGVGYALTSPALRDLLIGAQRLTRSVSTGSCGST